MHAFQIAVDVYAVLYVAAVLVGASLLLHRRKIQPLMYRNAVMVFLSNLGAFVISGWSFFYLRCRFDPSEWCESFICDFEYNWIVTFGYVFLIVPYLLRGWRVLKVLQVAHKSDQNQQLLQDDGGGNNSQISQNDTNSHLSFSSKYWDKFIVSDRKLLLWFMGICMISTLVFAILELLGIGVAFYGGGCTDSMSVLLYILWNIGEVAACGFFIWHFRKLRDDFGITFEITMIMATWFITTAILGILALIGKGSGISNTNFLDANCACMLARSLSVLIFSMLTPLYDSFYGDVVYLSSSCASLQSLDAMLTDMICIRYFRAYLEKESHPEYIYLWLEVEMYKDIERDLLETDGKTTGDSSVRQEQAARDIYRRYLVSGSDLFVPISKNVVRLLEASMDRGGHVDFRLVQQDVFQKMNAEYPRFLSSDECRRLIQHLSHEENVQEVMRQSGMLDTLPMMRGGIIP